MTEQGDTRIYKAVVNHEGSSTHSGLQNRANPPGWRDAGKIGTKQEVLNHIGTIWTDMRPLSLRKQMQAGDNKTPQV